ncbi:MAG: TetR/AcrR family transcriptional regulator [Henriciella sp.]
MTITNSNKKRRRRSPAEARQIALQEARTLLLESGPEAITLKAVAGKLDMAHGTIAHHFGSAAGLQAALAEAMTRDLVTTVEQAILELREGTVERRSIIDLVFDGFDEDGAGRLIAWLASSGHRELLTPLCETVAELVSVLQSHGDSQYKREQAALTVLLVLLPALGDSLLGTKLHLALSLDRNAYRNLVTDQLNIHRS